MGRKITLKEKFETNPYLVELKGKMFLQPRANSIIARGQGIINTETGEIINESVLIGKRKVVDKSQFSKIYASEIGRLYELSKTAQKVFLHLIKNMDYDNKAVLRWKKIYNSYSTAYTGLVELVENDIIAASDIPTIYWLNPTIVCKGERFAKYTEYVMSNENDIGEAMLSKQGKETIESMDEEVRLKTALAIEKRNSLFDSEGKNPYA